MYHNGIKGASWLRILFNINHIKDVDLTKDEFIDLKTKKLLWLELILKVLENSSCPWKKFIFLGKQATNVFKCISNKVSLWIRLLYTAAAKSLQSCPTLCDPIDGSPPGSPVSGILQARTLEWLAISFSNAWKWKGKGKSLSRVWLFATPWTAAHQAPLSM